MSKVSFNPSTVEKYNRIIQWCLSDLQFPCKVYVKYPRKQPFLLSVGSLPSVLRVSFCHRVITIQGKKYQGRTYYGKCLFFGYTAEIECTAYFGHTELVNTIAHEIKHAHNRWIENIVRSDKDEKIATEYGNHVASLFS